VNRYEVGFEDPAVELPEKGDAVLPVSRPGVFAVQGDDANRVIGAPLPFFLKFGKEVGESFSGQRHSKLTRSEISRSRNSRDRPCKCRTIETGIQAGLQGFPGCSRPSRRT
jgi:hypothetical protein